MEQNFTIAYIPSAIQNENELYQATDNVEAGLLLSTDKKVNANQIAELNVDNPFICLTYNSSVIDLSANSEEDSDMDSKETKIFDRPQESTIMIKEETSSSSTSIIIEQNNKRALNLELDQKILRNIRKRACIPKPDPVSQRNVWYPSDDMPELITDELSDNIDIS